MSSLDIAERTHFSDVDKAGDLRVPESPFVVAPTPEHSIQLTLQPAVPTARTANRIGPANDWLRLAEHLVLPTSVVQPGSSCLTALESCNLDALALEHLSRMVKHALHIVPVTVVPLTAV